MPPTLVYILAQGDGTRLAHLLDGLPKQLLTVPRGGYREPILQRTLRLTERHFMTRGVVVAPDTMIWNAALDSMGAVAHMTLPEPGRCVLDGIVQVMNTICAPARTVFLLGDVVFSTATVRKIADAVVRDQVLFIGRRGANVNTGKEFGELYAVIIPTVAYEALQPILNYAREGGTGEQNSPNLWVLLGMLGELAGKSPHLIEVDEHDFTDDIDTESDFVNVFPRLREAVAREGV